jgi:hypothetical protein
VTRVSNEHGSFEAPDAWTQMPGLGAAGCTPEELSNPTGPHPSMILTGDVRDAAQGPVAYVAAQFEVLAKLMPEWRSIDGNVTDAEPGPAVVRHGFLAPDEGWMVQFQAYWFFGERVSILTSTSTSAGVAAAWEVFSVAVASFEAPPPPQPSVA